MGRGLGPMHLGIQESISRSRLSTVELSDGKVKVSYREASMTFTFLGPDPLKDQIMRVLGQ